MPCALFTARCKELPAPRPVLFPDRGQSANHHAGAATLPLVQCNFCFHPFEKAAPLAPCCFAVSCIDHHVQFCVFVCWFWGCSWSNLPPNGSWVLASTFGFLPLEDEHCEKKKPGFKLCCITNLVNISVYLKTFL